MTHSVCAYECVTVIYMIMHVYCIRYILHIGYVWKGYCLIRIKIKSPIITEGYNSIYCIDILENQYKTLLKKFIFAVMNVFYALSNKTCLQETD